MIDLRVTLLAVGCVAFGALIAAELYLDPGEPFTIAALAPHRAAAPAATAAAAIQAPRADELLAATLSRPLFSPTRRPAAAGPETPNTDLAGNRLAGIVIAPDRRLAIFAVTGAKPLVLSEGESVSGWQIESIAPGEVSLVGRGGTRTLQPSLDPNPPPPTRAAAAPPPATPANPALAPGQPAVPPPNPAAPSRRPQRPVAQVSPAAAGRAPAVRQGVPVPGPRPMTPGRQQ